LPPEDNHKPYPAPNDLVGAFVEIWQDGDLDVYRDRLLYDQAEVTSDGEAYSSFEFYFIEPDDSYGPSWDLEDELRHSGNIFSGEPSSDGSTPGVLSIALNLEALTDWVEPESPFVEGDVYPEGTLFRRYRTDMDVNLDGTIEGTDINVLRVHDRIEFYAIPVDGIEGPGYRLWKWLDLDAGNLRGSQNSSWTVIKTLW